MKSKWDEYREKHYAGGGFDAVDEVGNKIKTLRFSTPERAESVRHQADKVGAENIKVRQVEFPRTGLIPAYTRWEVYPSAEMGLGNSLLD